MSDRPHQLAGRLALTVAEAAEAIGVSERTLWEIRLQLPHLGLFGEGE